MQFTEMGKQDGKTLLLLPGTACTWQINFHTVIDRLAEAYHLICVNYDGFEGDDRQVFTDMLTVTGKNENAALTGGNLFSFFCFRASPSNATSELSASAHR